MSAAISAPFGDQRSTTVESAAVPAGDQHPRVVASDELLQGRRELWIEHRGEMYRLRLTSAGKLYMTK